MGQARVRKLAGLPPKSTPKVVKSALPHYTADGVIALFESGDPRIQSNPYGTGKHIKLSDDPGYFQYSDKNGGTATFFAETWEPEYKATPVFTASIFVTDEMRASKCNTEDCNCKAPWTKIVHMCGCSTHHEGERFGIIPRLELCNPSECEERHAHLYGFCETCFDMDDLDGKALKDITADNQHAQLQ